MSPAMQRIRVLLPAPFSPASATQLARPHGEIHPVQGGQRAEPDPEPGHRELHGRSRPRGPRPRR